MKILGISPMHDSSVAVINDGTVEDFLKEERFSGVKRDMSPWKSLELIKEKHFGSIDFAVIASPFYSEYDEFLSHYIFKNYTPNIFNMSHMHHKQHASLAFYNSGFEKCLVVVVDRNGSYEGDLGYECESVFICEYPNIFTPLYKNHWRDNELGVVKVYESATSLIGEHPLENGKTMGLSSYGKNKEFKNLFNEHGRVKNELFTTTTTKRFNYNVSILKENEAIRTSLVDEKNYQEYADYAYQVQKQTQNQVLKIIKKFTKNTGIKNVCITGGYALNVIANNYYLENCSDINFYFEPIADDSGNSIGAAMSVYRDISLDKTIRPLEHTFFQGFEYKKDFEGVSTSHVDIVQKLIDGETVAVFNKKSEAGPRALGNRSILFDPRHKEGKKIVNKIKNREWYRPFGAVMLTEDFQKYFYTNGHTKNDYMTVAYKAKDGVKEMVPSVIHEDNTCRVQTVEKGHLYELLKEFKKKTGIGILLNTSFNTAGMPLVETHEEALCILKETKLDNVWFPEFGVYRSSSSGD